MLISIEEGRRRVLAAVHALDSEDVPLPEARGRVLAEDLTSAVDVPPFDSSAMDGYALVAGPATELEVIGESRAGHPSERLVAPGVAVRISTGAAVPGGASAVIPVERTSANGDRVEVEETAEGANIRRAGEDLRAGDVVLARGALLGPAELGVAASVGRAELRCARRPRVALLVTGDELVQPGGALGPGQIYTSNGFALAAQLEDAGAELVLSDTVPDTAEATHAALARALETADVVIGSGGVSVGPHDHVKDALRELGVVEHFWGVSLRPGKPTWFGVRERVLVFGLPGNPVSAMVTFQLFARPALAALQGADPAAGSASATLDEPVRRNPRREEAVRVRLRHADDGLHAVTTGEQGSHMLTSMLGADALALIAAGDGELGAGERVKVQFL
ncbi:MAG: gephyrin-like molybdotransferase Glp [Thermoleophilaceae bacterium]